MTQDRTRASYDAVAAAYAEALSHELGGKPLDRALLAVFAEQVRDVGRGESRVWDVGCGPGHVTAFLAGLGVQAAGIDLSGEMTGQAAKRHPDLAFSTGSMTALPAGDHGETSSSRPYARNSAAERMPSRCSVRLNCSVRISIALSMPSSPPAISP